MKNPTLLSLLHQARCIRDRAQAREIELIDRWECGYQEIEEVDQAAELAGKWEQVYSALYDLAHKPRPGGVVELGVIVGVTVAHLRSS